jgi:hypothetical protein
VTRRTISRQQPKYAHARVERVLEEVFSVLSAQCPLLGKGPTDTHSGNRMGVFYVVLAMSSAGKVPMNSHSEK